MTSSLSVIDKHCATRKKIQTQYLPPTVVVKILTHELYNATHRYTPIFLKKNITGCVYHTIGDNSEATEATCVSRPCNVNNSRTV